jgi:hypothetical protein
MAAGHLQLIKPPFSDRLTPILAMEFARFHRVRCQSMRAAA